MLNPYANDKEKDKIEKAAPLVGYSNRARYSFRGNFLFSGIPLAHTKVLDVGCGKGAWVIWAALNGAEEAIGIEPESDGSTAETLSSLMKTIQFLELNHNVQGINCFLDQLPLEEEKFHVIILFNVINHINEEAVVNVHKNPESFDQFVTVAKDIYGRLKHDGFVIVADCGRTNFWNQLGLTSPFAKSIEWSKHQDPQIWKEVFEKAGFHFHDLRWSPLQPFTGITGNWLVQYLTCSHFVIRFKKSR